MSAVLFFMIVNAVQRLTVEKRERAIGLCYISKLAMTIQQ